MEYVLGIDQGATKTHAIVVDRDGNVLGFGSGRGICYVDASLETALDYMEEAAAGALAQCGLSYRDMTSISAGLTGADWDYEITMFEDAIRKRMRHANVHVVNDCIIAMRSGTSGTVSGILCAGTGFNCAVRNGDDMFIYGYYVPEDCMGAISLARAALQAVYNDELGLGEKTALTAAVLNFFGLSNVDELLFKKVTGQIPEHEYRKLSILLGQVAMAGDPVAIDIWKNAGKKMAECLTARIRRMGLQDEAIEVVLSGSIFKCQVPQLMESVEEELYAHAPKAVIIPARYEPVVGAALLGLDKLYGDALPDFIYDHIESSAEKFAIRRL